MLVIGLYCRYIFRSLELPSRSKIFAGLKLPPGMFIYFVRNGLIKLRTKCEKG